MGANRRIGAACVAPAFLLLVCSSDASEPRRPCAPTPSLAEFKTAVLEAGIFPGGPVNLFEDVGRQTLATSIGHGLMPDHRVLDIGAGALRVGWWLLQYVEPANYHAIEPVKERIDKAATIVGADINAHYNHDFVFPDVEFDFVIARSIWTHASKPMISKMLSEFAAKASPKGRFLTSVIPAGSDAEDYKGEEWYGRISRDDPAGVIRHSLTWIEEECEKRGLSVRQEGSLYGQDWLVIERKPT